MILYSIMCMSVVIITSIAFIKEYKKLRGIKQLAKHWEDKSQWLTHCSICFCAVTYQLMDFHLQYHESQERLKTIDGPPHIQYTQYMKEPKIMKMDWRPLGYWPVYKDGKLTWEKDPEGND